MQRCRWCCRGAEVQRCAGAEVCRRRGVQAQRCAGAEVQVQRCSEVVHIVWRCRGAGADEVQRCRCRCRRGAAGAEVVQIWRCRGAKVPRC